MKNFLILFIILTILNFRVYATQEFVPIIKSDPYIYKVSDAINLKNDENIKQIYKDLFNLHFSTWKEEFLRQTNTIEKNYKNFDRDDINMKNAMSEEEINNMIIKLNEVINEKNNRHSYAEACFKLALYSYLSNKIDPNKAIEILDEGLKELGNFKENTKLFVRMNLFAGDLALIAEKYSTAKEHYINIITKDLDLKQFREDVIRAYLGLGDSEFETYHFQEAKAGYEKSLLFSKDFSGYSENKYTLLIGQIKMRLIWATYRNAEYSTAVEYVQNFAREKSKYDYLLSKLILDDVIRVGALSLYEARKKDAYIKLAKDKAAGDFGKQIIINSFYYFTAAGYQNEVEEIAKEIEKEFYFSRYFPDFIKSRLVALGKAENLNKYNELSYYATAYLAKDSIWKNRFNLTEIEEENRRSLIENLSLQSAKYYFNLGQATGSRSEFLKSAEIYRARLDEYFQHDLRGVLFQSYGHALFMARDYDEAWKATEESFKHPLDEFSLKISWFQLVNISREQSQDIAELDSILLRKYKKAVAGFIAHFPKYVTARNYLFEYAKRLELLGDFESAKNSYEKLLSLPSLDNLEQDLEEKDRVSLNLANLLRKMGAESKIVADDAGSLEKIGKDYNVSESVSSVIKFTNYSLAIEYAKNLKTKGELYNSAKFLELWGKNYRNNISATNVLLTAMNEFSLLQKWERVDLLSNYFIENHPNDLKLAEAYYWKARASDAILQFSKAAQYYIKSSNNTQGFPELSLKILALKRAVEILQLQSNDEIIPELLQKISIFENQLNPSMVDFQDTEIASGFMYLEKNNYLVANKIFKNVIQRKKLSKIRVIEANIGLLHSNLYLTKDRINAEKKFDKYIADNILSIEDQFIKNRYLEKSVMILNNFDYSIMLKENEKNFSKYDIKNIEKMNISKKIMSDRIQYLSNKNAPDYILAKTYLIYGKITLKLSESYAKLNKFFDKKDNYLINKDNLQSEAKKYLYAAYAITKNNVNMEENIELSALISKFDKRKFTVNLPTGIADKQEFFEVLDLLPLAMGISSNNLEFGRIK